jgi:hypothetical protein
MLLLSILLAAAPVQTLDRTLPAAARPVQTAPMPPAPTLAVKGKNGWAAWTCTNAESVSILAADLTPLLTGLAIEGRLCLPAGTYLFVAYGYNERTTSLWVVVK